MRDSKTHAIQAINRAQEACENSSHGASDYLVGIY